MVTLVSVEDWRIKTGTEGIHQLNSASFLAWGILNLHLSLFQEYFNHQAVRFSAGDIQLGRP